MSYLTQARLAGDQAILHRVTACAASEGIGDPSYWAQAHSWVLSAQPGWDDAYGYAFRSGVESPGEDEGVITDQMILAAVQKIANEESAAE